MTIDTNVGDPRRATSPSIILMLAAVLLAVGLTTPAWAIPVTVSFEATGFGAGAPTDPVIGTIVYDAASTTSNINSLTSISLTIGSHAYTVGEVGFVSPFGTSQVIGALTGGVTGLSLGSDDFFMRWDETTLVPDLFGYTTASSGVTFFQVVSPTNFTRFSVTADTTSVPEPGSLALFMVGVVVVKIRRLVPKRRMNLTTRVNSVVERFS